MNLGKKRKKHQLNKNHKPNNHNNRIIKFELKRHQTERWNERLLLTTNLHSEVSIDTLFLTAPFVTNNFCMIFLFYVFFTLICT